MGNLTILEQESLQMLRQLEYCCQLAEVNPKYVEEQKCVYVMFNELKLQEFGDPTKTQNAVSYLQRNGVNFVITFDLENDILDMYIDKKHPTFEFIELGQIKGENLEEIQRPIQALIQKLTQKTNEKNLKIEYKENLGQFFINKKSIKFVGKQKDILDILSKKGKEIKVSWDEINDQIDNIGNLNLTKEEHPSAKKKINETVKEINKKTSQFLEENKPLINLKENEYWLQYDIKIIG